MPASGWIAWLVLPLTALSVVARPACAQPPSAAHLGGDANATAGDPARLLKDAQGLLQRQQYRKAEELLTGALERSIGRQPGASLSPTDCLLINILAEVLIHSGRYQSALTWLERAERGHQRSGNSSRGSLADQAATMILLSKAYNRLDRPKQAAGVVRTIVERYAAAKIVDPVVQLELLAQLASFEDASRPLCAGPSLSDEANRLARQLTAAFDRGSLGGDDYARGLTALAECQMQLSDWAAFVETTNRVIRLRATRHETLEELAARRRLAGMYRDRGDNLQEVRVLRAALDAVRQAESRSGSAAPEIRIRLRYEQAEIERLLASALLREKLGEPAAEQLAAAQADFASSLVLARQASDTSAAGVSEGRLLERIADVAGQRAELAASDPERWQAAIGAHLELLANYRQTLLPDDPRLGSLLSILGALYLKGGDAPRATPLLEEAEAFWRGRNLPDPWRLAQTLHLLGEAALVSLPPPPASTIEHNLREAHGLCLSHFAQDPLRWRIQLALGRLYVATGRYRKALSSLEPLATAAESVPNDVASAALLQTGLLHKQLLRFDEANRLCRQGLELRRHAIGEDDPELVPFFLALGSLEIARRDAGALEELIRRATVLGIAASNNSAWRWEFAHQQAMWHYLCNEQAGDAEQRQAARTAWQRLLDDEPDLPTALRARTLHYLARLDYLDWSGEVDAWNRKFVATAAASSRQLAQLGKQLQRYEQEKQGFLADFAAYDPHGADKLPAERQKQFRDLLDQRASLEKKRSELRRAHAALLEQERARAQSETGVQQAWLSRLDHGLKLADEAIGLLRQQGIYPSLQFTALCNVAQLIEARSRYTAATRGEGLNQAQARLDAAVALIEQQRSDAVGDDVARAEFFAQYHTAYDLLVQFHLDAHSRSGDQEHLVQAMVAAEQCRGRTLLDQVRMAYIDEPAATPAANQQSMPADLARMIRSWRDSNRPLLYYYVGSGRSYLFLLGGSPGVIQPIRLQTDPEAADFSSTATDASARWIDLHVGRLHASLSDPQIAAAIGTDRALRLRLTASSLILLPREAREFLQAQRSRSADYVVVVPHGALAQLPLEALVVDEPDHLFLDDVAPPLAYAASLALLDHLERLPATATPPTVLTLGNPNYLRPTAAADAANSSAVVLAPLPDSQKECDRIVALFGQANVTKLDRDRASEERLRKAIRQRRFSLVHLAAHGVMTRDDLNPWLALVPAGPAGADPATDGRLDLREIYGLNLAGCELTVLSACNTNLDARQAARLRSLPPVGSEHAPGLTAATLDTGFSIANAFLAAGSRRVIGTQWTVSDDSTAELVSRFFEKLQARLATGQRVNYARLLGEARADLRQAKPEWNTPFHWAPFVLVGPADAQPR